MSAPPCPDRPIPCIPFSQLAPRPLSWLWPSVLPRGKLVLLQGDPGLGKSLLALDLCARLTTGRPWPDGSPAPEPANVLVLNAEDGTADTVRPRLLSLGADPKRAFIYDPDDEDSGEPLRLPSQADRLGRLLAQTAPRLV